MMQMKKKDDSAITIPQQSAQETMQRLKSNELFCGHKRVIIEHGGVDYYLQVTRQGKLILTK